MMNMAIMSTIYLYTRSVLARLDIVRPSKAYIQEYHAGPDSCSRDTVCNLPLPSPVDMSQEGSQYSLAAPFGFDRIQLCRQCS